MRHGGRTATAVGSSGPVPICITVRKLMDLWARLEQTVPPVSPSQRVGGRGSTKLPLQCSLARILSAPPSIFGQVRGCRSFSGMSRRRSFWEYSTSSTTSPHPTHLSVLWRAGCARTRPLNGKARRLALAASPRVSGRCRTFITSSEALDSSWGSRLDPCLRFLVLAQLEIAEFQGVNLE